MDTTPTSSALPTDSTSESSAGSSSTLIPPASPASSTSSTPETGSPSPSPPSATQENRTTAKTSPPASPSSTLTDPDPTSWPPSSSTTGSVPALVPTSMVYVSPSLSTLDPAPEVSSSSLVIPTPTTRNLNVGAIAGGTVGGFVVLVLIGSLVFCWFVRRRRQRVAPSAAYKAVYGTDPPPMFQRSETSQSHHFLQLSQGNGLFELVDPKSR
ncbi:hypothetical protein P691DRAFT_806800 [Macrolepiota fuliginosa MF-IS2]|uniref:Uncharacterized protein n=1 Tax=Macrolepiota fuliginosa MF-IS2 TaxID=1400762 RepID=A0A9P5XPN3_9AGAR|nr:hypothetical protein P691DRAFT_806800 [Macrolepiota fuliginosa MF-IS2]